MISFDNLPYAKNKSLASHLSMNSQPSFSSRVAYLSLLYLLLPTSLWIGGWFRLWVSIPVMAGMCWMAVRQRKIMRECYQERLSAPKAKAWLTLALIAAGCVFICGFDGRLKQSWDFLVRNPIYHDLINGSWPWQADNGDVLIYPVQFWLVPAFLSYALGGASAQLLQIWTFLGIFLTMLNLYSVLGKLRSILFFPALLLFAPLTLATDDILNVGAHVNAIFGVHYRLPSALSQLLNTFHYFTPLCLFLSLLLERKPKFPTLLLISSMIAVFHPMMAGLALPVVLCKAYAELHKPNTPVWAISWKTFLCPELLFCSVIVLLASVYYLSSTSGTYSIVFNAPYGGGYSAANLLICISGIILNILPLLLVWLIARKNLLLLLAAYVPFLIIFWIGGDNGISEWFYKFSVIYSYCIIFFLLCSWKQRKAKLALACLTAFSLLSFAREFQKTQFTEALQKGFVIQQKFINNKYNGSIKNAIGDSHYSTLTKPSFKCAFLFRVQNTASH